jgi:hypothetical protein
MFRGLKRSFVAALLIFQSHLTQALAAEANPSPSSWPQKMRSIEKVFQELLIDLNSDERFTSPKNFKRIEKNSKTLSELAHTLKSKEGKSPDLDPSIQLIASLFAEEADHAYQTLRTGQRPYARKVLKSMSNYCVACHTRSNGGPSFQFIAAKTNPLIDSLKGSEKATYFSAVRQFDQAIAEYEKVIRDSEYLKKQPFEWERALRSELAILVRVKKDPDLALKLIEQASQMKLLPYFMKELISDWKKSLLAWKAEKPANLKNEEDYFQEANRLINLAKAAQKYPVDQSADIYYLRATSVLHDQLGLAPNGNRFTEGLYLVGICYEVLQNMNLNEMHEYYYQACIVKSPHTEQARKCYQNYEESIYLAYTGSSGTHIPHRIKEKLNQLELTSLPQTLKPFEKSEIK